MSVKKEDIPNHHVKHVDETTDLPPSFKSEGHGFSTIVAKKASKERVEEKSKPPSSVHRHTRYQKSESR